MAEKKAEAAESAAPKGKSKLLLFIIIGVVALLLIGGGATVLLMKKSAADAEAAAAEDGEDAPAKEDKHKKKDKKAGHDAPPAFFKFDKPFTVKLQGGEGGTDAYLQAEVQLKISDPHGADALKAYDPELKHKLTLTLMAKKVTDINNAAGVQRLSYEMRDVVNEVLDGPKKKGAAGAEPLDHADPDAPVQAVLFTSFIVQ